MNKPLQKPLHNLTVLVTRPQYQAQNLCQMITAAGGIAIPFATIAIHPAQDLDALTAMITQLDKYDLAIFLSANAVCHSSKLILHYWQTLPKNLKIAAIGTATQSALKKATFPVHLLPKGRFNSEGLLALPELQHVSNQKIILFAGENGRTLLADTLTQRGAIVDKAIAYRRMKPDTDSTAFIKQWQQQIIDVVVCTSNESLINLFAILGTKGQNMLIKTLLVGISDRLKPLAKKLGFTKQPIIAGNAGDEAIIKALRG